MDNPVEQAMALSQASSGHQNGMANSQTSSGLEHGMAVSQEGLIAHSVAVLDKIAQLEAIHQDAIHPQSLETLKNIMASREDLSLGQKAQLKQALSHINSDLTHIGQAQLATALQRKTEYIKANNPHTHQEFAGNIAAQIRQQRNAQLGKIKEKLGL